MTLVLSNYKPLSSSKIYTGTPEAYNYSDFSGDDAEFNTPSFKKNISDNTFHFKEQKNIFKYRTRGRHKQIRLTLLALSPTENVYELNEKINGLLVIAFSRLYLFDQSQLRGPPLYLPC